MRQELREKLLQPYAKITTAQYGPASFQDAATIDWQLHRSESCKRVS